MRPDLMFLGLSVSLSLFEYASLYICARVCLCVCVCASQYDYCDAVKSAFASGH